MTISGHAIECRINAESATDGFLPSPGIVTAWAPPAGEHVRLDTHGYAGYRIPPFYDSLLAKLIVSGADRTSAVGNLEEALEVFDVGGVDTTIDLHRAIVAHRDFRADEINTRWLETVLLPGILPIAT